MKTALCLAGHFRHYPYCKIGLEKTIKKYNCDIFIHSYTTKSYLNDKRFYNFKDLVSEYSFSLTNTKKIVLEKEDEICDSTLRSKENIASKLFLNNLTAAFLNQLKSLRKKNKVLELVDNSYDFIILTRPDCLIKEEINFNFNKLNLFCSKTEWLKTFLSEEKIITIEKQCIDKTSFCSNAILRDDLIAGPAKIVKNIINKIYHNFGKTVKNNKVIFNPHKVLLAAVEEYEKEVFYNKNFFLLNTDDSLIYL